MSSDIRRQDIEVIMAKVRRILSLLQVGELFEKTELLGSHGLQVEL